MTTSDSPGLTTAVRMPAVAPTPASDGGAAAAGPNASRSFYPHDSVLAAYAAEDSARVAEQALADAGVDPVDVWCGSGAEVAARQHEVPADRTLADRFEAFVARHHGDGRGMMDEMLALARQGETLVIAHAPGDAATARAVAALRIAGPRVLRAYSHFTVTDLPLEPLGADEPGVDSESSPSPEDPTTRLGVAARNATLARAEFAAYNRGALDAADWLYAENYVDHNPPPAPYAGRAGWKAFLTLVRAAVPDARFTIDVMVAEGDVVARRWTQRGTWTGPLFGAPPTGRPIAMTGMDMLRFRDARVVERWHHEDTSAFAPAPAEPSVDAPTPPVATAPR